ASPELGQLPEGAPRRPRTADPVTSHSLWRDTLGGLPEQRQHRQSIREIPLTSRNGPTPTRDPRHLADRAVRIRKVLQDEKTERGVERLVEKGKRFRGTHLV